MTLERPPVDIITRRAKPGTVREGWIFTNSHEWLKLSYNQPYVGADQRPRPEPMVIEPEEQRRQPECRPGTASALQAEFRSRGKKCIVAAAVLALVSMCSNNAEASEIPEVPTVVTPGL